MKLFGEWQAGRTNKKVCEEESGFAVETSQIQDLETNICDMTAESLNFRLTKFIIKVLVHVNVNFEIKKLNCMHQSCYVCNSCLFSWPLYYFTS